MIISVYAFVLIDNSLSSVFKPQLLDFEEDDTVKKDVRITYRIPSDLVPYSKYEFRLSCSFLSREFGPDVRTEVTTKEAG